MRFQSTRLSRASALKKVLETYIFCISIHKALASLDGYNQGRDNIGIHFNPQGSREPRLGGCSTLKPDKGISIHKALASLDFPLNVDNIRIKNFNPQGSREPRPPICSQDTPACRNFNPQGSREPRPFQTPSPVMDNPFQSTRLSRASTLPQIQGSRHQPISIHKALASLDSGWYVENRILKDFNPQGSREPRPIQAAKKIAENRISIHKALASLDARKEKLIILDEDFNPQGSREPRQVS